jgi:hypothetical protein
MMNRKLSVKDALLIGLRHATFAYDQNKIT